VLLDGGKKGVHIHQYDGASPDDGAVGSVFHRQV
jgi:hypothetical protein